jgi:hypothetical protein
MQLPLQPAPQPVLSMSSPVPSVSHQSDDNAAQLQTVEPEDPVLLRLREQAETAAQTAPDKIAVAWETLVNSFPARDVSRILDILVNARGEALAELRQLLIRRWAAVDPEAAAAWAVGLSDSSVQMESLEQIAVVWYQNNPANALAWAAKLPDGDGKTAVILSLGCEVSRVEPLAALSLVSTLPPSEERDDMVIHGVSQWAAENPSAASYWAVQIPDEALRQRVLVAIGVAWAGSDSVAAATFALDHLPPGAEQDRAVVSIVQRWVQTSPESAAKWIEQFPALPVRYIALQNLVAIWMEQDSASPVNWLRGLPSGTLRDESISVYAQTLAPRSFQSAQIWAAAIEDSSLRALCQQAIGRFAP